MYEKVNPCHPDKVADRIAGAIVDLAYKNVKNPKIAVEVLIGHGVCHTIIETSEIMETKKIEKIIKRIGGDLVCDISLFPQDKHLSKNQDNKIKCGDNGIFVGLPIRKEEHILSKLCKEFYKDFKTDAKFILDLKDNILTICQSNASNENIYRLASKSNYKLNINPLGEWKGGTDVDTGATNRKLGSDMGFAVTGGGLHGKDLSKADITLNVYAHLKAQVENAKVEIYCSIGDEYVDNKPYCEIVEIVRDYIFYKGGFEKFAEWGLI